VGPRMCSVGGNGDHTTLSDNFGVDIKQPIETNGKFVVSGQRRV